MYCHDFQQSVNHLMETEEEKTTQTLLEMHCERSSPFGTGGLMFAGADPFSNHLRNMSKLAQSTENNDVYSINPCALKIPFELELIVRTLEKVAFGEPQENINSIININNNSNNNKNVDSKRGRKTPILATRSGSHSRNPNPNRSTEEKNVAITETENKEYGRDNGKIPSRLCNMSFNDSFNLFGTDNSNRGMSSLSGLNPEFCHDWWGWGDNKDSEGDTSTSSGPGRKKSSESNKGEGSGSKGEAHSRRVLEAKKTRSGIDTETKKTVGGIKRPRGSRSDGHSKKTESCTEGEEEDTLCGTGPSESDRALSSITIVLNEDDSDGSDDDGKSGGKRPNTHKKGQPQGTSAKKQVTRRNYKTPSKAGSSQSNSHHSHNPKNKSRASMKSESSPNRTRRRRKNAK